MTNNNAVYENNRGAKHYRNFAPMYDRGTKAEPGKYGQQAEEYLKETAPVAYEAYSAYVQFKSILTQIDYDAARLMPGVKARLKKLYPTPKTDDFAKLAKHSAKIEQMAEEIVLTRIVYKPYITDDEVLRAKSAKHGRVLN